MALVSKTRGQILSDVANTVFGDWAVISGETPSAASATSITFSQFAGLLPDSHFDRASIRATVSGSSETKRVASFDGDLCTFTLVGTGFSGTPSNIKVFRAGVNLPQIDTAIDRAANAIVRTMIVDVDDTTLMYDPDETELTLPSDTFVRLEDVYFSWASKGRDRYKPARSSTTLLEHSIQASTTGLSQGFLTTEEMLIGGIALPLRKVGSPDYTLTLALYSNSSGAPSSSLGSMTALAATKVSVNRNWPYGKTTTPIRLAPETVYHIALLPGSGTTLDSSNYYTWLADSAGAGIGGNPATSSNSGSTWSATSGYTRGFRLVDVREMDWCVLNAGVDGEADWWSSGSGTRSIVIKPDTRMPIAGSPFPVRLVGQGKAASIAGSANDGTTYTGDPEILTQLAVANLQLAMAMAEGDSAKFAMAKKQEMDALERAKENLPRLRGVKIEDL